MPILGMKSIAQLKCIYTNACSMGKKQEELEAIVQQENYDFVAITETWWDDSHDWSAAMDGYKLFRRDRQGRRGRGVALLGSVSIVWNSVMMMIRSSAYGKKRRVYHFWKKGQATQEEYRDLVKSCKEKIRKAKAQLEPNLATVVKDNKTCFYKYINNKQRAKENLPPLSDAAGNIATKDEEKAEVLNAFFASVCNSQISYPQGIQPPEVEDRDREQNKAPVIQEEAVNDLLHHLDTHKSMGLDGIHLRVLRELAEELAKPLSIIYQQSCLTGEVPDDWRLANVMPIYKKGRKEDPGNYRPGTTA
ncbi:hypothetical protein QYF61_011849 [Mycteria americana]|uniref:Rna-directed dna polymerase from mobile element jockey-like n=1 Tax=Mycteria americana TaxID=33587 RepID=A0AAN7N5I1_MYCAM|nr:hypothetical protein QYF61_011849 [Mycteria americana]